MSNEHIPTEGERSGVVKFFLDHKGFGFITPDQDTFGKKDVFVHISDVIKITQQPLKKGDVVFFHSEEEKTGERRVKVTKLIDIEHGADDIEPVTETAPSLAKSARADIGKKHALQELSWLRPHAARKVRSKSTFF